MAQLMHEARLEMPEEIDSWEEVDAEDVKEDMRRDRLRMRWEKERRERVEKGLEVDEQDEGKCSGGVAEVCEDGANLDRTYASVYTEEED